MWNLAKWLFPVLVFGVAPPCFLDAGEEKDAGPADGPLRQAILRAKTSQEAGRAYRAFFRGLDRETLELQENDPDVGIALQAAWELHVERAIARKRTPHAERFLGFLEGRTKLRVPLRWEVELVTDPLVHAPDRMAVTLDDYLPLAPFLSKKDGLYHEEPERFDGTPLGPRVTAGTRLKKTEGEVAITVGDATVTMEEQLFQQVKKEPRGEFDELRAVLGSKRSYVVWYDPVGGPFPLICLDSHSGKLLWRAQSWGSGADNRLGFSGPTRHDVYVSVVPGKVVLFGSTLGGSCYLEAFSAETGSSLYRFSSNSWCIYDK
jgi:hypothetical protein